MADSGIECSDAALECLKLIQSKKSQNTLPGAAFEIRGYEVEGSRKKANRIEPIEGTFCENIEGSVLEYFKKANCFDDSKPAYIVCFINVASQKSANVATQLLFQVNWVPDSCNVKERMLASSSIKGVGRALAKVHLSNPLPLTINDQGSLEVTQLLGDSVFEKNCGGNVSSFDGHKVKKVGTQYKCAE